MREVYKIRNKSVIWNEKGDLWDIIILPDSIMIDNWHGPPHIYITDEKIMISSNDPYKVFFKVKLHIESENGAAINKLLEDLR